MRKSFALLPIVAALMLTPVSAQAAHSGPEIKSIFDAGVAAYDAGDYAKAFSLWIDLEYEDVAAMRNAAMLLRKGQGVAKDPERAMRLYGRAAQIGLPTAQADLADMLLKGEAGPPDLQSALPLLQAAAAANHPVAQYQLGQLYETGAPPLLEKNWEVARQLYAAAASHGMTAAADRLRVVGMPDPNAKPVAVPGLPPVPAPAPAQTVPAPPAEAAVKP